MQPEPAMIFEKASILPQGPVGKDRERYDQWLYQEKIGQITYKFSYHNGCIDPDRRYVASVHKGWDQVPLTCVVVSTDGECKQWLNDQREALRQQYNKRRMGKWIAYDPANPPKDMGSLLWRNSGYDKPVFLSTFADWNQNDGTTWYYMELPPLPKQKKS